jgi:hypothetical protein
MGHPEDFYAGLAGDYDALFDDWWTAAAWHGDVVAGLLTARRPGPGTLNRQRAGHDCVNQPTGPANRASAR